MGKKLIRLFVSSTFTDFMEERDILNRIVFPKIEAYCKSRGYTFQAVDLRFGVSKSAVEAQDTMGICLEEVKRCQETHNYPNFMILMGNRYGWCPLPTQIVREEFELLKGWIITHKTPLEVQLLTRYRLDENQLSPTYFLLPKDQEVRWAAEEAALERLLKEAIEGLALPESIKEKYYLSATGHEIVEGILKMHEEEVAHAVCFYRELEGITALIDTDYDKQQALEVFKTRIKEKLRGNFYQARYEIGINENKTKRAYLESFTKQSEAFLTQIVKQNIDQKEQTQADTTRGQHRAFFEQRCQVIEGRDNLFQEVVEACYRPSPNIMVLWGVRGVGKTSFIAGLINRFIREGSWHPFYRFTGVTNDSMTPYQLIESLREELCEAFKLPWKAAGNYGEATLLFSQMLQKIPSEAQTVILVDAIDQLISREGEDVLLWIPKVLPYHVKLIVSTREGEALAAVEAKEAEMTYWPIPPLKQEDGAKILATWLAQRNRTLTRKQYALVLSQFVVRGLPLYLRLAQETLVEWKSYETYEMAPTMDTIIEAFYQKLCQDKRHGKVMTDSCFGYILISQYGMSEKELLALLEADKKVMAEYYRRFPDSPRLTGKHKLPFMVWSRFYFEVEMYFKEMEVDGLTLYTFYHLQLQDCFEKLLESQLPVYRRKLIKYLKEQPNFVDEIGLRPNMRKLTELPYQYKTQANIKALAQLVAEPSYIQADRKSVV